MPSLLVYVRAVTTADELVIIVTDDGPGLTDEHASQIFTRFYRGDSSRARTTGGSGLGLAIAESIADVHGGTIDLRTAPGEGCEFTVRIPTHLPNSAPPADGSAERPTSSTSRSGRT